MTLEGIGDYPALWPPAWRIADDGKAVLADDGTRLEFGEPVGLGGGIGGVGTGTGSLPEACSGDEVFFVGEVIR